MSHIPKFRDATTSLAGDAASPAADAVSPAGDAVSPTGDLFAAPNFGICDTTPFHYRIDMSETSRFRVPFPP